MNLQQMRYVLAVAEELNFARAAARCHVSQPPLSRAIRHLEDEVGARLFDRDKHKVSLTPAGKALVEDFRQSLHNMERGIERARQAAQGLSGTLRIGFGGSSVYALLPRLVRRFRKAVSDVSIEFCTIPVPGQIDALRADRIDLGVLRLPIFDDALETRQVHCEALVSALPTGHRLLSRSGAVSIRELREEQFVAYEQTRGFNYHADLVTLCRIHGFDPQIMHCALTTEAVIGIVASGEGVAIVPAAAERLHMYGVAFRPLDAPDAPRDLLTVRFGLAWRREDRASPASRFAQVVSGCRSTATRT